MTKSATQAPPRRTDTLSPVPVREGVPFQYLQATHATQLDIDAATGLPLLRLALEDEIPRLVRALVDFSLGGCQPGERRPSRPPTVAMLNRRRRAARTWLQAIADGRVDGGTRYAAGRAWLPQLAGAGHRRSDAWAPGRALIEFLRGQIAAIVFSSPDDNLLPAARAMHTAEAVLAAHLGALGDAVATAD